MIPQAPDYINDAYKEAMREKKRFKRHGKALRTPNDILIDQLDLLKIAIEKNKRRIYGN